MLIRDRIRELRRVKAAELRPHPKNWRTHPDAQRDALRGLLAEIGYAAALIARELDDGSLELIDGHLRAETTPDGEVPVLVVDLSPAEADKLLATFDPLSAMAGRDDVALRSLLGEIQTGSEAVRRMLDGLLADADPPPAQAPPPQRVPELFQIVVECRDEQEQRELFDQLSAEGHRCRLLAL